MPLMRCRKGKSRGWKWGGGGVCFIGTGAKEKALQVGRAIHAKRGDQVDDNVLALVNRRRIEFRQVPKRRPGKVPRWRHPFIVERKYTRDLLDIVKVVEELVREVLFFQLPGLVDDARSLIPTSARQDAWPQEVTKLLTLIELRLDRRTLNDKALAIDIGQRTNRWNDRQWQNTLKKVMGVDIFIREPWLANKLESFTAENVKLIKSLKLTSFSDIEGMTQRGIRQGKRHETIRKEIEDHFDITRGRAKLIARDQISKLNGQLTKERQTSIGLSRYIWHDSGDNRVRISHSQNDNLLMDWSNPSIYYPSPNEKSLRLGIHLHPGEDYQCRCWAEGFFDDVSEEFNLRRSARTEEQAIKRQKRLTPILLR